MSLPLYALIMAGGSGTRLWPLSRQARPKQVLKLIGDRTMFQLAVDRLLPIVPPERIITITTAELVEQLSAQAPQLPRRNFLAEPEGRGTAPVIGLGANYARHLAGGNAVLACLTADHYIKNVEHFRKALLAAAQAAAGGQIVTLGITPSFPSTGFGYIERGAALQPVDGFSVYHAQAFREKPDEATAVRFANDGMHSWNSGMFVWTTDRVHEEFGRQLPATAATLEEIARSFASYASGDETELHDRMARLWHNVDKQTIDYGIMEGASKVAVIPVEIGWSDVGSWASLLEVLEPDASGNVTISGDLLAIDSRGVLLSSDKLVTTIGLNNMVIVDTEDALLVCPRDRSQDVKLIVERLQKKYL